MEERSIDVLCITETWLLPHTPDSFINIPNYNVFICDNGRGAGACAYVRDDFKSSPVKLDITRSAGIEDVWLNVQCRKLPSILVGCLYPKALTISFDYIEEVLRLMSVRKMSLFILGDFNENLLLGGNKLSRLIRNNKLTQIIDKPTRITSTSATLLDLIITNNPDIVLNHDVVPQVIADHDLISVQINVNKPKRQPIVRTFHHFRD